MTKKFTRTIEDFVCGHCGKAVKGNGYTNHCPACLWSKHVDLNPGDRANLCQGLMEPVGVELKDGRYDIISRCVKCGFVGRNKSVNGDDFELLLKLSSRMV